MSDSVDQVYVRTPRLAVSPVRSVLPPPMHRSGLTINDRAVRSTYLMNRFERHNDTGGDDEPKADGTLRSVLEGQQAKERGGSFSERTDTRLAQWIDRLDRGEPHIVRQELARFRPALREVLKIVDSMNRFEDALRHLEQQREIYTLEATIATELLHDAELAAELHALVGRIDLQIAATADLLVSQP